MFIRIAVTTLDPTLTTFASGRRILLSQLLFERRKSWNNHGAKLS
jgi:hypothetical protein